MSAFHDFKIVKMVPNRVKHYILRKIYFSISTENLSEINDKETYMGNNGHHHSVPV